MAPANFELLMNLLSLKIVKKDTRFRAAIPRQDRLVVTLRFWATGNSYTHLQYLSQISKQCQIVPKVCEGIVEALMENKEVKTVYCTEQTVLHLKSMCWNNETKYITNKVLLII